MSEFTVGDRYGSEDMYRDFPNLRLGSKVAVKRGDTVYTDTIDAVSYTSPTPAIYPTLTRWQRFKRAITPKSRRKPLRPIRAAKPAQVTVSMGLTHPGRQILQNRIEQMQAMLGPLTKQ